MRKDISKPCWFKYLTIHDGRQGHGNWKDEEQLFGLTIMFPFKDDKYKKWTTHWSVGISAAGMFWYEEHDGYRILQKQICKEIGWSKVLVKHIPSGSCTTYCLWKEHDIKGDMRADGHKVNIFGDGHEKDWFTIVVKDIDKTAYISIKPDRWDRLSKNG